MIKLIKEDNHPNHWEFDDEKNNYRIIDYMKFKGNTGDILKKLNFNEIFKGVYAAFNGEDAMIIYDTNARMTLIVETPFTRADTEKFFDTLSDYDFDTGWKDFKDIIGDYLGIYDTHVLKLDLLIK